MFDTMTWVKVLSGLCGTFLVFLLGGWASELIYHGAGGHGDGHEMAYVIHPVEEEVEVAVVDGPSFDELFAAADAGAGERVFRSCSGCHKIEDGENGAGPHLYGIVGRDVAAVDGFGYSGNLIAVVQNWTPEELDAFIADPSGYAPGTGMSFRGISDAEDRANLIAWLDTVDD